MIKVLLDGKSKLSLLENGLAIRGNLTISGDASKEKDFGKKVELLLEDLQETNTNFSLIVWDDNRVFAAVDQIRSMPIYYANMNQRFYISDSIDELMENIPNAEYDKESIEEFKEAGYVTSKNTLVKNIYALQSGEYILYDREINQFHIKEYVTYGVRNVIPYTAEEAINKMKEVQKEVFHDLIDTLGGRQVVIPLSGGYDSRLLLEMLCSLGYKNILCFTYGKKGNVEAIVSEKVAREYDVPWCFVEYTEKKLKAIMESEKYKAYIRYANGGISLAHMQDFLAVCELKEQSILQEDAIFIPGHAYDFLAGTHLTNRLMNPEITLEEIADEVIKKHYVYNSVNYDARISKIKAELKQCQGESGEGKYHYWEWKERQSKYIAHAITVYEFFGYEWRLPFWDRRLMEYWDTVPVEMRKDRKLFLQYMKKDAVADNIKSANDRKMKKIRNYIPASILLKLYRVKCLMTDNLCFNSTLNFKDKLKYVFKYDSFTVNNIESNLLHVIGDIK